MRVRKCTQCGDTHPLEYFHRKSMVKSDGLASQCKFCRSKNAMKKRHNEKVASLKAELEFLRQENEWMNDILALV